MFRSLLVLVASSVLFLGCGIFAGGDHACDLRPKDDQCTDWRNLIGPTVTQEGVCRTLAATGNGTWKPNERCDSENSVGGCQTKTTGTNILQTNWFYAPKTEAEVRAECADDGTTFVPPGE